MISIKLRNFKRFEEQEFKFNDENFIEGKNGEGKSTIKDAVFFCFYNRSSEGSLSDSTKYITDGKQKCLVEINFEKNGETYTIGRERSMEKTRITYLDGSQSEEDSTITQRELESIVPDYELMQCVFNIGYFMKLSDKEKRDFMLRLTKDIDSMELFKQLGGTDEDIAKFGITLTDINRSHLGLLKQRRELQKTLDDNNAVIADSKEILIPVSELNDIDLGALEKEREKCNNRRSEWLLYNSSLKLQEQTKQRNAEIREQISKIEVKSVERPSLNKLNQLKEEQINVGKIHHIPEGRCSTCLQDIQDEHKDKVNAVNDRIIKRIEQLDAEVAEERINYANAEKIYEENEKAKKTIEFLEAQLRELSGLVEPEKLIEFDEEKYDEVKRLKQLFDQERNTIELLTRQEGDRKDKIVRLKEKNLSIVSVINRLNKLIEIMSPSGITQKEMEIKLKPIIYKFKKLLPDAEIETLELLKNGLDSKEVFNIFVSGRNYDKCSTGERMKVDIAISQIIDSMVKDPIECFFLDNSESLSEIPKIKTQFFIAQVTNNNLQIK